MKQLSDQLHELGNIQRTNRLIPVNRSFLTDDIPMERSENPMRYGLENVNMINCRRNQQAETKLNTGSGLRKNKVNDARTADIFLNCEEFLVQYNKTYGLLKHSKHHDVILGAMEIVQPALNKFAMLKSNQTLSCPYGQWLMQELFFYVENDANYSMANEFSIWSDKGTGLIILGFVLAMKQKITDRIVTISFGNIIQRDYVVSPNPIVEIRALVDPNAKRLERLFSSTKKQDQERESTKRKMGLLVPRKFGLGKK